MLHRVLVREGKEDLLSEDGQEKNPGQPFLNFCFCQHLQLLKLMCCVKGNFVTLAVAGRHRILRMVPVVTVAGVRCNMWRLYFASIMCP